MSNWTTSCGLEGKYGGLLVLLWCATEPDFKGAVCGTLDESVRPRLTWASPPLQDRNPRQPPLLTAEFPAFLLRDISSLFGLTEEPHSRREPASAPGHGAKPAGLQGPKRWIPAPTVTTEEAQRSAGEHESSWSFNSVNINLLPFWSCFCYTPLVFRWWRPLVATQGRCGIPCLADLNETMLVLQR